MGSLQLVTTDCSNEMSSASVKPHKSFKSLRK